MTFEYGSFFYFLYLLSALGVTPLVWLVCRRRSPRFKKAAVLALMLLNVFQHFFKQYLYPHLWGNGFDYTNTIYNVCSFLIVASPFVFLSHSGAWKDFIALAGSSAGLMTMLVPYWYVDGTPFSWEILHFYVYHGLLFCTSLLPLLLGMHRLSWKNFWKIGILFYLGNILVLFNNVVVIAAAGKAENLYALLVGQNPLWMFAPPSGEEFKLYVKLIELFSPRVFFDPAAGVCVPFLWSAVPLYLVMTLLSFIIGCFADGQNLERDFRNFFSRSSEK